MIARVLAVAVGLFIATSAFAQTSREIDELRALLTEERARIAALEARLDALAQGAAAPVAQPAAPSRPSVPAAATAPRFDFYGDSLFRFVAANQTYDGCTTCLERYQGRMRLRFGVQGQIIDGLRGSLGLASGELNDPNTVYQTFGANFSRKAVSWDRAFVTYRPPSARWMELTVGKFPYPWTRSSMTFDVDFYPEGATQRFSVDLKNAGIFKNVTGQAMQLVASEQPNASDTLLFGGQGIATLGAGRLTSRLIGTVFEIAHPENLLRAQLEGSNVGVRNTNIIVGSGSTAAYVSGFRYINAIAENTFQTPSASWPITVAVEYQHNIASATGASSAASFRIEAGRPQRAGDWQFGWHMFRVEQDAIISAFGESDWRAPTNVLQHRVQASRMMHPRIQALVTWYRGRTLDSSAPGAILAPGLPRGSRDPWANRFYFDLLYGF